MILENVFTSFLESFFGEEMLVFMLVYTILGLFIITLIYSILGKQHEKKIWDNQDFLSKTVYGFMVGVSSWIVGLPLSFLLYYLWGLMETTNIQDIYLGAPILVLSSIYGIIGMYSIKKWDVSERTKPLKIFYFTWLSFSLAMGIFVIFEGMSKIIDSEYFAAVFLILMGALFIYILFLKEKALEPFLENLE